MCKTAIDNPCAMQARAVALFIYLIYKAKGAALSQDSLVFKLAQEFLDIHYFEAYEADPGTLASASIELPKDLKSPKLRYARLSNPSTLTWNVSAHQPKTSISNESGSAIKRAYDIVNNDKEETSLLKQLASTSSEYVQKVRESNQLGLEVVELKGKINLLEESKENAAKVVTIGTRVTSWIHRISSKYPYLLADGMTNPEIVDEVFSTYLKYRVFDNPTGRGNGTAKNGIMLLFN
jgi:hypothetical protein